VESTGIDPFSFPESNTQSAGVALRSAARPLYVRVGAGFYLVNRFYTPYDVSPSTTITFALNAFTGIDVPHTHYFAEAGALLGSNSPSHGLCFRLGLRL